MAAIPLMKGNNSARVFSGPKATAMELRFVTELTLYGAWRKISTSALYRHSLTLL